MSLTFTSFGLSASADLGTATFSLTLNIPSAPAVAVGQIFLRQNITQSDGTTAQQWIEVAPVDASGNTLTLNLFPSSTNTFTWSTTALSVGTYDEARIILFDAASNYSVVLFDQTLTTGFSLAITTTQIRIASPTLVVDPTTIVTAGASDGNVHIPYTLKWPASFTTQYSGLFLMAKGSIGYVQPWADLTKFQTATGPDPYLYLTGEFILPMPAAGVFNAQFGIFNYGWTQLAWYNPGVTFEIGGNAWVVKCPAAALPPRLQVVSNKFETLDNKPYSLASTAAQAQAVGFALGGDYGNAITWTDSPLLNSSGYFGVLHYAGLRFIRTNFNADRYLNESMYRDEVDQIVQNQLAGGLYPIIAPQDLPVSSQGLAARTNLLVSLATLVAQTYKGMPVWIEIVNEPSELAAWSDCKPVMEAAAQAIRAVDANALIICPVNSYSKGSTADLAADPITSVHIDLYDYHAYNTPSEFTSNITPALAAGLPVLIGEYGGGDAAYLNSLNIAFQTAAATYPNLLGIAAWAWTVAGQDDLPLVADASTPVLKLTDNGNQILADYNAWMAGSQATTVTPSGPATIPLTSDVVAGMIGSAIAAANIPTTDEINTLISNAIASAGIPTTAQINDLITAAVPTTAQMRAIFVSALNARFSYVVGNMHHLLNTTGSLTTDATIRNLLNGLIVDIYPGV